MSSLKQLVTDETGRVNITADSIAQFSFLMRKWSRKSLLLEGDSDEATRRNINVWLQDFETNFGNSVTRINTQAGFGGYSIATYEGAKGGLATYEGTKGFENFVQSYKTTIQATRATDLSQARMLRNNLAVKWGDDWKLYYEEYGKFSKSAQALGLTLKERQDAFLASKTGRDFVFMIDQSGRKWQPGAYARMYARTRSREIEDIIMLDKMNDLEMDVVQISNANTNTPICLQYEGKYFSLTGATPNLPVLDIFPPFHPNCVHRRRPVAEVDETLARKQNIRVDRNVKKLKSDWTASQKKQIKKQEAWNVKNRANAVRPAVSS